MIHFFPRVKFVQQWFSENRSKRDVRTSSYGHCGPSLVYDVAMPGHRLSPKIYGFYTPGAETHCANRLILITTAEGRHGDTSHNNLELTPSIVLLAVVNNVSTGIAEL